MDSEFTEYVKITFGNTCQNLMPMQKFRYSRQSKEMTGC